MIQRILEDFKRDQEHSRNQICKKKSTHHQDKNEKGEFITSRKGIANVFGEFHKKLYDDQEHEETQQEHEENETESSIDVQNKDTSEMKRIPEITTGELQTAINRLKNLQTAMESEPRTSKLAM